jgi:hypothetical protein
MKASTAKVTIAIMYGIKVPGQKGQEKKGIMS